MFWADNMSKDKFPVASYIESLFTPLKMAANKKHEQVLSKNISNLFKNRSYIY